jgi:predicted sulfurtransferase
MTVYTILLYYKYVELEDVPQLVRDQAELCKHLKGRGESDNNKLEQSIR